MAFVSGVGGAAEPARLAEPKSRPTQPESGNPDSGEHDGVRISDNALRAVEVHRLVEKTKEQPEVRAERVQEARARLENGVNSVNEVLQAVAGRLSHYVSNL